MSGQPQEFKNKVKVSNPLNDLAANLGVTLKVLIQLAMGPDKEFREMVRGLLSILPEEKVVWIAEDADIDAQFLDYLSRIFEAQPLVLQTLLRNPSTPTVTIERISRLLPEATLEALARDPGIRPELLEQFFKIFGNTRINLLKLIATNPVVPLPLREQVALALKESDVEKPLEVPVEEGLEDDFKSEKTLKEVPQAESKIGFQSETIFSRYVNQLIEINFDIVENLMKQIHLQSLEQLERLAEANRQILQVVVKNATALDLEALQLSSELVTFVMRKLPASVSEQEILEFFKKKEVDQKKVDDAEKEEKDLSSFQEEVEDQKKTDDLEEKEEDPTSLEEQIKRMTVGERLRLARKGGMQARRLLIRDTNKEIAKTVLENPKITETEVEAIASMREVPEEVLRAIGAKKEWIGNYNIMLRLIKNPKTPVDLSISHLARLGKKDLDQLQKSKAVPEIVRSYAKAILLQRLQSKR